MRFADKIKKRNNLLVPTKKEASLVAVCPDEGHKGQQQGQSGVTVCLDEGHQGQQEGQRGVTVCLDEGHKGPQEGQRGVST